MKQLIKKIIPQSIRKEINIIINKGSAYECPLCNYQCSNFFLIGSYTDVVAEKEIVGAELRKGGCYKCGSTDRERLIYLYLKDYYKLFEKDESHAILHVAPEKNLTQKILSKNFKNYHCGDLFTEGYSYDDHVKNMNLLELPFEENTFDLIVCNHVLEHIPDHKSAMQQIYKCLKSNGTAILQVPFSMKENHTIEDPTINTPSLRKEHYGQFDHVRLYGLDYPAILESVGFVVEKINITTNYPRNGLNTKEPLFICSKK